MSMPDAVNPRGYRSGTRNALFEMAKGTCYYPGCDVPTIVFVGDGQPATNVHIAHIEGAERQSARYNQYMTNEQRRAFSNLLLLCLPHHDLVDNKDPRAYTVETLRQWKQEKESQAPQSGTSELSRLDEETLKAALESAALSFRPKRGAEVEVRSATIIHGGASALTFTLGQYPQVSRDDEVEKAVALTVRSTGDLPVTVHAVSLYCRINGDPSSETKLMGRDDYVGRNPRIPARVEAGDAKTWLTALATFAMLVRGIAATGNSITHFRFDVDLGSGEVLKTDVFEIDTLLPEA